LQICNILRAYIEGIQFSSLHDDFFLPANIYAKIVKANTCYFRGSF